MIFLLQYNSKTGMLESISEYSEADAIAAQEASLAAELRAIQLGTGVEVVLLEAASLDALRQTHSRYFQTLSDLSKLRGREKDK
jgi:hypothetical protein